MEQYRKILDDIIAESRRYNITLILLTRPYLSNGNNEHSVTSYNEVVKEVASQQSIHLIEKYFFTQSAMFVDQNHLNQDGLVQMSQLVRDAIIEYIP